MTRLVLLLFLMLLLIGGTHQPANSQISYTIKITSPVPGAEATVSVQTLALDSEEEPVTVRRTTPFEISAEAGVFSSAFTRLAGAAEIQVDVYCEGCRSEESPILYGSGTRVTLMLEDDLRTFDVQR